MGQSETSTPIPDDVLDQVEFALRKCYGAALVLAPSLGEPYPDAPDWSPYTRWLEPAAKRAYEARRALSRARGR
jgi:hypothetical protein